MEKAETFNGKSQVNHYDAEGLRHEIEENGRLVSFIFSDREVVAEREKESTMRYIRGYDILCSDSECARTYYHYVCDEGGSTSHVLDETGKVLNQYEYDAFGNLIKVQEEVNNRFLYVGQQYDAITMQYYLRARYYNPVVARFTQEDIYRGDGLNLYAYCQNNPVGYYDLSGHSTCGDSKKGKSKSDKTRGNRLPNLSPEGAGRNGAYRAAKRKNNIPMSEQPKVKPNVDKRGKRQPGKIYEFENGVEIRDDAKGHKFPDDPTQDRGPHFNDPSGNHFDY